MINVVDRVPTKPNRVRITHEDGTSEYVTWERADEPTVVGTPINKALFDSIKADLPLMETVTKYVSTVGSDTTGNGTQAAPYATIQKAVNSIPKNLGGFTANISIAPGVYPEYVQVANYQGGALNIGLTGISGVTINGLSVHNSQYVSLNLDTIEYNASNIADRLTLIYVAFGSLLTINKNLVINNSITGDAHGIYVGVCGKVSAVSNTITINNSGRQAVFVSNGWLYAQRLEGSNNQQFGVYCNNGGFIGYGANEISAATGNATGTGGRIFAGSQSSVPQY